MSEKLPNPTKGEVLVDPTTIPGYSVMVRTAPDRRVRIIIVPPKERPTDVRWAILSRTEAIQWAGHILMAALFGRWPERAVRVEKRG